MIFLVDYDNIDSLHRNRGLVQLVEHLVRKISVADLQATPRIRVRLYGGWYENQRSSRTAQRLAPQIQADFPRPVTVSDSSGHVTTLVNVELAQSLECDPTSHFLYTYRTRSPQSNLKCAPFPIAACIAPGACPIGPISQLFQTQRCPIGTCNVTMNDILFRAEQKLVDAMLVTDLLYFATKQPPQKIAVVSSDDDIWPGIYASTVYGAQVHHIQTIAGRATPSYYTRHVRIGYHQYSM